MNNMRKIIQIFSIAAVVVIVSLVVFLVYHLKQQVVTGFVIPASSVNFSGCALPISPPSSWNVFVGLSNSSGFTVYNLTSTYGMVDYVLSPSSTANLTFRVSNTGNVTTKSGNKTYSDTSSAAYINYIVLEHDINNITYTNTSGITVSYFGNETIPYGNSKSLTTSISAATNAEAGTYLGIAGNICATGSNKFMFFLLTIGASPYSGAHFTNLLPS